jgi:hypothetical protein
MAFYGTLVVKVGGVFRQYIGGGTQLFLDTKVARTALTATQTKALFTTPISLVPAPGAGKFIEVLAITATNTFGTIAYTGGNALEFRYTDGSGTKVTADIASTFINLAAGVQTNSVTGVSGDTVRTANAAVVVRVPTGNPAAGDGIITFIVHYRIVPST